MLIVVWLTILLFWVLCGVVLIGLGSLLLRHLASAFGLGDAFWAGLVAAVAILEVYHFFRPIDSLIAVLLVSLGLAGFVFCRFVLLHQWKTFRRTTPSCSPMLLLVATLVAARAAGPCDHYDTGLYGSSLVRWTTSYALVPGLANLHGRFGFNSSVFLCVASLDQGILRGISYHLFAGLLLLAFVAMVAPACERLVRGGSIYMADGFLFFLLIPTVSWIARAEIVGTTTDLPAAAALLVACKYLLCGLEQKKQYPEKNSRTSLLIAILTFALAITFKLSMVVTGGLGMVIAFLALARPTLVQGKRSRLHYASLVLSALLLLPWIGRSLMLSGYPFFPNSSLSLPVDWRVPTASVNLEAARVRSWARLPHASPIETEGFGWLAPWSKNAWGDREGFKAPVLLSLTSGLILIIQGFRLKLPNLSGGFWLVLASFAGLIFWFIEAPALRFGEGSLWASAAVLASCAIYSLPLNLGGQARITALAISVLLAFYCVYPRTLWIESYRKPFAVRSFVRLPKVAVVPERTDSGLTIFVPVEGDQCWETDLLCTPDFNRTLRLRSGVGLQSGFRSESSPH